MAVDYTVKIFDQFYNLNLVVSAPEYEIVLSYFQGYTFNKTTAKAFTDSLFRISNLTQIPVLTLLQNFQNGDQSLSVSLTMAYYLNSIGNKTIMYGVNNLVAPNNSVARNIVQ